MKPPKRHYDPMVMHHFYEGLLTDQQLKLIPKSTQSYWNSLDRTTFYGSDWIKPSMSTEQGSRVNKREIDFQTKRLMAGVYSCYKTMFAEVKSYKKLVKNNAAMIVSMVDQLAINIPLKLACKVFSISNHQYYRLKNKVHCSASVLNLCFKAHPHQLTLDEVETIRVALKEQENKYIPLSSIYYELVRCGKLFCCLSVFYKYASLFRAKIKRVKDKQQIGFRASKPFDYLHVDTTFIPTSEHGNIRVAFVKDNYSKAYLNAAVLPNAKSLHIKNLLVDTFNKFGLPPVENIVHLVSDGGSENKGDVLTWINNFDAGRVIKLIAKTVDFSFSNSMSERLIYIFKHEFLKGRTVLNWQHLIELLAEFEIYYNHNRFPIDLTGYTPMEVLLGAIPDSSRFREQIQQARKQRFLTNKSMTYCGICA